MYLPGPGTLANYLSSIKSELINFNNFDGWQSLVWVNMLLFYQLKIHIVQVQDSFLNDNYLKRISFNISIGNNFLIYIIFYRSSCSKTNGWSFRRFSRLINPWTWALINFSKHSPTRTTKSRLTIWYSWHIWIVCYIWAVRWRSNKSFLFWKTPCLLRSRLVGEIFENLISWLLSKCPKLWHNLGKFINNKKLFFA